MADAQGPVQPGSPKQDLPLERREDFGPNYQLMPNKRSQPVWPKCGHREDAVLQVLDDPFDGGRRFFRCPHSGVQLANSLFHVTANTASMLPFLAADGKNAALSAGSILPMNDML